MKLLGILCLSLAFSAGLYAQAAPFAKPKNETLVTRITLGRQDKNGNIEEGITEFTPTDVPIYCFVDLASSTSTSVKLAFYAVKVRGVRPNQKVITSSYQTKDGEDTVTFTGRPAKNWLAGEYRVEILIDGVHAQKLDFIVKSP